MIKVVIIDDESRVCSLIKLLGKWDEMGMVVVGTAGDGDAAYELIMGKMPDIVITDIKMPGMSGLEVIQRVQEQSVSPFPYFIVISGYQEFEYAHKALQFGVEEYLLKPINKEELNATLLKLKNKILSAQKTVELHIKVLFEQFMLELLEKPQSNSELLATLLEQIADQFPTGYYAGMAFTFESLRDADLDGALESQSQEIMYRKMMDMIEESLSTNFKCLCIQRKRAMYCLVNSKVDQCINVKVVVEKIISQLLGRYGMFCRIVCGLSENSTEINDAIMKEAIEANRYRLVCHDRNLFEYSFTKNEWGIGLSEDEREELQTLLSLLLVEDFIKRIDDFKRDITQRKVDPNVLLSDFVELFLYLIDRLKVKLSKEKILALQKNFLAGLEWSRDIAELVETVKQNFSQAMEMYFLFKSQSTGKHIAKAKEYIARHYDKAIELSDIAQFLHLSPGYLSILFKDETGINFKDYLINLRIERAKELLENNASMSIAEICALVGYSDQAYFSKQFSRIVGISPSQYRKRFY